MYKKAFLYLFVSLSLCVFFFYCVYTEYTREIYTEKNKNKNEENVHYSAINSASFFDDAYVNIRSIEKPDGEIKGVLVNHHLLAPQLIAETIHTIATDKKVTVILLSPNHFDSGKAKIISSLYRWDTPYGILDSNSEAIADLEKSNALAIDEFPFKKEHGISSIVPFIKKSLPNARIVPIIVKDTISQKELLAFADTLHEKTGDDTLIIGSFDFSHYLPSYVADFHDEQAIQALSSFDYNRVKRMETDSLPGVELFMRLLQKNKAETFTMTAHSNSAKVLHDMSIEETTSYINGMFSLGEKKEVEAISILSFGDMMLDRMVRQRIIEHGNIYPFEKITRLLMGNDIVVANAEGPFTHYDSKTVYTHNAPLTFTFDTAMLPTLKRLGFTVFSQANNHTLNFGKDGLQESGEEIERAGISFFGDPSNNIPHSHTEIISGKSITFIGYHQFVYKGLDIVLSDIREAKKKSDFVIVYPHFGEEYKTLMTTSQINTSHAFIDAGADAVVGAHPHVIEPIEIYKGKAIFYSLGNFIFDQGNTGPTSEGLSVGITIKDSEVTYRLFPLRIYDTQASLMREKERVILLETLAKNSPVEKEVKEEIKKGMITLKNNSKK